MKNLFLRKNLLFFLFSLFSLFSLSLPVFGDDFDTVAGRIAVRVGRVNAETAEQILSSMNGDGTWNDVNYQCQNRSTWASCRHLSHHVLPLAEYYRDTKDVRYSAAAVKAMHKWISMDLKNPNWWWNVIGAPMYFADAAMCLLDQLTPEDRVAFADYLEACQLDSAATGMNALWLSRIVMQRAILRKDDRLLRDALVPVSVEMSIADDNREGGIKRDWSYQQHGRMVQFGNYGCAFINALPVMIEVLKDTPWELPSDKLENIRCLLLNGFRWVVFKGELDVTSCGRQLHEGCQAGKAKSVLAAIERFRELGMFIPREDPIGFRDFFLSGYCIYRTKNWMASVRMSNQYIDGVETTCNSENMKGGHIADGSLFLYSSGGEYRDIFPLWGNWRLLPGVTTYLDLPPVQTSRRCNTDNNIASYDDGQKVVVMFKLNREGLQAEKQWIFTKNGVQCRGGGITASNPNSRVVTCVENCLAGDDASIIGYKNGVLTAVNNGKTYMIRAPKDSIHAEIAEHEGDWKEIMGNGPSKIHRGTLFTLWIDHGKKPENASYSYQVKMPE